MFGVVAIEYRGRSTEQVFIVVGKIHPALRLMALHSFVDEQDEGPGDGLMIQAILPDRGRKPFEPLDKPRQRRRDGIQPQVQPCQPDVIAPED